MALRRRRSWLVVLLALGCASCSGTPSASAGVRCGNGRIDAGEACDRGSENDDFLPGACRTDCTAAGCGDGVLDPGEACDDGPDNSDEAPGSCRTTCLAAGCGDGVVDEGETCDDGAANSDVQPGACRTACVPAACGDGVVDATEGCDEGAANDDLAPGGCRTDCVPSSCGDGVVDPGEECDEGASNDDLSVEGCRTTCRLPHCGDGVLREGEECDDGPGNSDRAADACRTTCRRAACGDGTVDSAEACDEGARNADDVPDACRSTCVLPACGDGIVDRAEACDDGEPLAEDGCTRHCELYLPETCLVPNQWYPGPPLYDLREVGIPEGTGFRVESSLEESGVYSVQRSCGSGYVAFYAYPVPAAGDLVVELEMAPTEESRAVLGVWRSCTDAPSSCAQDLERTGRALLVVPDVSPADGVYFVQVDQDRAGPARYALRVDVRPPLAAGQRCATDGSLGRCDPATGLLACADPDGDGYGSCVPLLDGGASCDPAGQLDHCREPLVCRDGTCAGSCGDGDRQAWEACDDGNGVDGDNCSNTCEPLLTSCPAPFDLNLAWDPVGGRAEWRDDTSRTTGQLQGTCGAGAAPEAVATFVAPAAGRYHLRVAPPERAWWAATLSVLGACDPVAAPLACGAGWLAPEVGVDLAAGQRIFVVVDGARRPPGSSGPEPRGPFTMSLVRQVCGDGVLQGDEVCDDGNVASGDRCLPDCTLAGDDCGVPYPLPPPAAGGVVEWHATTETFSADGLLSCATASLPDAVASFTAPAAGRYVFVAGDGAQSLAIRLGGCSSGVEGVCESRGWADTIAADVDLAEGDTVWAFVAAYTGFGLQVGRVVCGDGLLVPSEECDDGNGLDGDGCDRTCRLEALAEVEPNDLRSQAQPVPLGRALEGSLTTQDRDYLAFDLVAGTFYDLSLSLSSPGACVGTTPSFWLYGPNVDLLETWPGQWACDLRSFAAPVTGRYFLRLEAPAAVDYFLELQAR